MLNRELRILQEIETAISQEFFKDVRKRLRGSNRKSSWYFDRIKSPSNIRRPNKVGDANKTVVRRHSSVERYLETKEMDSLVPKYMKDAKERSLDIVDGKCIEIPDFRSHPNLSDHEMDSRTEEPVKLRKINKLVKSQGKNHLSPTDAKVTFSGSTYDVRSDKGSIVSQRQNLSSMLDFELDVVVDIDSGKCVLHSDKDTEQDIR